MNLARWSVGQLSTGSIGTQFRGAVIGTVASDPSGGKPPLATWAESFIFAGSSALLLLVANLFPHWWYFSFFALTPFLYRIIKAAPGESLRLGFLFGLSFFAASAVNSLFTAPLVSVLKLISGTALFALFGWSVGWARERWGFNPSIVAVLWVGLEMGLVKLGFAGGLLGEAGFSNPFLHGLVGLFGFLAASAIIVLLNSLLVLVVVKTLEKTRPRRKTVAEDERTWDLFFTRNLVAEKIYLVPEGRAPPIFSMLS
jgi:apolipoprotein N-acyltransferase